MRCEICNHQVDNFRKLSKHIRDKHKEVTVNNYYDLYLLKEGENRCVIFDKASNTLKLYNANLTSEELKVK